MRSIIQTKTSFLKALWCHLSLSTLPTTMETTKTKEVIWYYGLSMSIVSDQDTRVRVRVIPKNMSHAFCWHLYISVLDYNPQSNRWTEWFLPFAEYVQFFKSTPPQVSCPLTTLLSPLMVKPLAVPAVNVCIRSRCKRLCLDASVSHLLQAPLQPRQIYKRFKTQNSVLKLSKLPLYPQTNKFF